jgi:predicted transcriptional regulator
MTHLMEKALAAVRRWPASRQDEAAEMLLALDRLGPEAYRASDAELRAVDEALAQAERGEFASEAEVEAAFARFRK